MDERQGYEVNTYIREIEGLRALAVLAVMLFHADPDLMPGGFTGVDIFFVISGFLITSGLIRSLESGSFSFVEFYTKRAKRLLPSALLVLSIFTLISYWLYLPEDIKVVNESVRKSLYFWANHYFSEGQDYFGPRSSEIPFLHFWSLSIEEQFYIVWPLFLFLLYKMKLSRSALCGFVLIGIGLSLAYAEVMIGKGLGLKIYFSSIGRFGEIAIGALIAIGRPKISREIAPFMTVFGLGFIIWGFVGIDKTQSFPGFNSLYPTIGTALLILSRGGLVSFLLANKMTDWIGSRSYQLYLWHWPVLAVYRYVQEGSALGSMYWIIAYLIALVLSELCYRYVEVPIRYSFVKKPIFVFARMGAVVLGLFLVTTLSSSLYFQTEKFSDPMLARYGKISEICHGHKLETGCIRGYTGPNPKKTVLVFGDSHAAQLNHFFNAYGELAQARVTVVSGSGCPMFVGFDTSRLNNMRSIEQCVLMKQVLLDLLKEQKFDRVYIAAKWRSRYNEETDQFEEAYIESLRRTLELVKSVSQEVVIMNQVPYLDHSPRKQELLSIRAPWWVASSVDPDQTTLSNKRLKMVAGELGAKYLDLNSMIHQLDIEITHGDRSHINGYTSLSLGKMHYEKYE